MPHPLAALCLTWLEAHALVRHNAAKGSYFELIVGVEPVLELGQAWVSFYPQYDMQGPLLVGSPRPYEA